MHVGKILFLKKSPVPVTQRLLMCHDVATASLFSLNQIQDYVFKQVAFEPFHPYLQECEPNIPNELLLKTEWTGSTTSYPQQIQNQLKTFLPPSSTRLPTSSFQVATRSRQIANSNLMRGCVSQRLLNIKTCIYLFPFFHTFLAPKTCEVCIFSIAAMTRRPHEEVPGVADPLGILPGIVRLLGLKRQTRRDFKLEGQRPLVPSSKARSPQ